MDQKKQDTKLTGIGPKLDEEKSEGVPKSFDTLVDEAIKNQLIPLHALISEKAINGKEPQLDLAGDKIAQAMTALQVRLKERKKKGIYGQQED